MTARRGPLAWLEAGLKLLRDVGPEALTIERLCGETGRTKGSFYHHFTNAEGFRDALLDHWRRRNTEDVIAAAEAGAPGVERRRGLDRIACALDQHVETAFRRLAAVDPAAARVVAEVDARRIGYIATLMREDTALACDRAQVLARLSYALFVGLQTIDPDMPVETVGAVKRELDDLIRRAAADASLTPE